jgi:hypothetical protein
MEPCLPSLAGLRSLRERGIDILEQHDAALGRIREQVVELVVRQASLGQVEDADVVVERTGERLDEGRFARAGRSMQEVTSSIRDACEIERAASASRVRKGHTGIAPALTSLRIPLSATHERLDIVDDSLLDSLVQHDTLQ